MSTRHIATLIIMAALAYAPLAHGCVTDEAWFVLDGLLAGAFGVHCIGCLKRRQWPLIPLTLWIPAGLLLVLGCMQMLNPSYIYDPVTQGLNPLSSYRPYLPGTIDQRTSIVALIHWGALALGFFTLVDLTRHREMRWWLQGAIASIGGAIALFGIILKIQGGTIIPFTQSYSSTFFATYVYHAHAAAFLNLCWPAALSLTVRTLHGERPVSRALWINVFVLIFLALFINISKFGHLSALPSLALAFVVLRQGIPSDQLNAGFLVRVVLGMLLLGVAAVVLMPLVGRSVGRWDDVMRVGFGIRPVINGVAISIIRHYPLWGTGPGSFHLVVPYFTVSLESVLSGRLTHAHQDYLQTVVEWGVIGASLWLVIVGGGVVKGVRDHLRHPEELSTGTALVALTILGCHALVDFPLQTGSLRLYAAVYLAMVWRVRLSARKATAAGAGSPT
jgi:O-antigen ligase